MRTATFVAAAAMAGSAFAYPGMKNTFEDIKYLGARDVLHHNMAKRQNTTAINALTGQAVDPNNATGLAPGSLTAPIPNAEMIGDLLTQGATTDIGKFVQKCLTFGLFECQNQAPRTYQAPGPLGSAACAKDTCCVWDSVARELITLFTDTDGTCNQAARAAVRMGFHDAGVWSKTIPEGGADGSILLNPTEVTRAVNAGLGDIVVAANGLLMKYGMFGVKAADLVQFMANTATVVCPLGPRMLTLVGREDSAVAPEGIMPEPTQSADVLITMFQDKSFIPAQLAALVGAHSSANQFHFNPNPGFAGLSLDSTPGIWDVKFYQETGVNLTAPKGVIQFPSDIAISADPRTAGAFNIFGNTTVGQVVWNANYAYAQVRLSLLGVNNINELVDCTHVLPAFQATFNGTAITDPVSPTTSSSLPGATKTPGSGSDSDPNSWATETIYETQVKTITSCAPTVTNCPAHGSVVTETKPIGYTVVPKSDAGKTTATWVDPAKATGEAKKVTESAGYCAAAGTTTTTVYTTVYATGKM